MKRFILLACAVVLSLQSPLPADEPNALPSDLAAVPANAIGFVHIRVSDLWRSALMKDIRDTIVQAGPKALQAFDERTVPPPSTIERITVVMVPASEPARYPPFVTIVACSKAFDHDKALKSLLPQGEYRTEGGNGYVADDTLALAVRIIDDQTLAIAAPKMMKQFLAADSNAANPFAGALHEAAEKRMFVLAAKPAILGLPEEQAPQPLQPLMRVEVAQLTLDVNSRIQARVRVDFANEEQARAGEAAIHEVLKTAKKSLDEFRADFEKRLTKPDRKGTWPIADLPEAALSVAGLGALNQADEWLRDLPLSREGKSLAAAIDLPVEPFAVLVRAFGTAFATRLGMGGELAK